MSFFFTIITVTKNAESKILKTLRSVNLQTFKNYQHIVVDSFSSDKTYSIISDFNSTQILKKRIRDKSLYEGLNNALNYATGSYVLFLHAGDFFFDCNTLYKIKNSLEKNIDILIGGCVFYRKNLILRSWKISKQIKFNNIYKAPHTGAVIKLDVYKKIGKFNTKYFIASDTDYLLKITKKNDFKIKNYNNFICFMEDGGLSTSKRMFLKKMSEDLEIYYVHYKFFFLFKYCLKIMSKLPQYLLFNKKFLEKKLNENLTLIK